MALQKWGQPELNFVVLAKVMLDLLQGSYDAEKIAIEETASGTHIIRWSQTPLEIELPKEPLITTEHLESPSSYIENLTTEKREELILFSRRIMLA